MKKILFITFLIVSQFTIAQSKGTLKGLLTDKETNNEPLPFANVVIKGTTIGTTTDIDGNYTLKVPEGNQVVVFSFLGYKTIEKSFAIKAGETVTINQIMSSEEGVSLDQVVVTATKSRETASALLLEQKKATVIKESIGAEELSKKGVSDAAGAATKVAGITKQQGSSKVYVRGLGDRYNTTTLNGLPLPSNDPTLKNIALDLFTSNIIQNIGVSKTFSSNLDSDISGANIDISSKEHVGKSGISVGISSGVNTQTTGKDFKLMDGANWFGVANSTTHPISDLNTLSFNDSFTPNSSSANPSLGVSISGGKKFDIGEESSLSMFLVGGFDNNYLFRDGFSINYLREDGAKGNDFTDAKQYDYSTNKLAMGNFVYKINYNYKVAFNTLFIHTNSQKIQDYFGKKPDVAESEGEFARIILQTQNQNKLFVNQLLFNGKVTESIDVNAGVSYNTVNNDEPNRRKNLLKTVNNITTFASGTARNNSRYYHNLNENDLTGKIDVSKYLGTRDDYKIKLDLGFMSRLTNRTFNQYYFDYDIASSKLETEVNNIDASLNQANLNNNAFRLKTHYGFGSDALEPMYYTGKKIINAGYAVLNYQVTDKFFINAGVRLENNQMDVSWKTPQLKSGGSVNKNESFILPSLNAKYNFSDDNLMRVSASKTYTFPQFKEVAPFPYEGVDYIEVGNENLKPSTNYNVDIKWEIYPTKEELVSVSVFGKWIKNAINRVEQNAASDGFFSYDNTGDAQIYGAELEARKNIFNFAEEIDDFSKNIKLGFNLSYMYTNQVLTPSSQFNPTKTEENLEGAAPFIANADVSYNFKKDDKETIASIIYNYQGQKVYSVGANFLEGIYEVPVSQLDFIFKHSFNERIALKLSAKNLLNPSIERFRNVPSKLTTRSFKRGVDLSVGITYNF